MLIVDDVKRAWTTSRTPLFAVFVDIKAAFDLAFKDKAFLTLAKVDFFMNMFKLLVYIIRK